MLSDTRTLCTQGVTHRATGLAVRSYFGDFRPGTATPDLPDFAGGAVILFPVVMRNIGNFSYHPSTYARWKNEGEKTRLDGGSAEYFFRVQGAYVRLK
jgi:hypothetical protein